MIKKHPIEVLLVEDNPYDAELIIDILTEYIHANNIQVAKDGAEALDYLFNKDGSLKKETPKLILLDLKLPKVNGLEVLRKIKADAYGKGIPVVVLTSSNEESDIEKCYRLGVNSYLTKPIEFECFMKTISSLGHYWLLMNKCRAYQNMNYL